MNRHPGEAFIGHDDGTPHSLQKIHSEGLVGRLFELRTAKLLGPPELWFRVVVALAKKQGLFCNNFGEMHVEFKRMVPEGMGRMAWLP